MQPPFDLTVEAPGGYKAMLGVHGYVQNSGLYHGLLELVKLRVSQVNGCAFCLAMHVPLARQAGVTDDQLNLLVAWREAPVFTCQERAALAWAVSDGSQLRRRARTDHQTIPCIDFRHQFD